MEEITIKGCVSNLQNFIRNESYHVRQIDYINVLFTKYRKGVRSPDILGIKSMNNLSTTIKECKTFSFNFPTDSEQFMFCDNDKNVMPMSIVKSFSNVSEMCK